MKNTISVALLGSAFVVSALAGSHAAVKESGFYGVGGFGYGSIRETPAASFDTRADIAYALSVGYQINKVLGVEAGYMVFPSVRGLASFARRYTRTNTSAITLLGRYTHVLSSAFDLTAGAGVSVMSREEGVCGNGYCNDPFSRAADFCQVVPTFSLGANYHVSNKVSLGVEGRMTTHAAVYPETYTGLVNLSYRLGA